MPLAGGDEGCGVDSTFVDDFCNVVKVIGERTAVDGGGSGGCCLEVVSGIWFVPGNLLDQIFNRHKLIITYDKTLYKIK